jgi:transposase-like protein
MTIAQQTEQILRVKQASFHGGMNAAVEQQVRSDVVLTVQTTLEAALVAEVESHLTSLAGQKPRRSGYYGRAVDTQYGRIAALQVPKLRFGNSARSWQILTRYQRSVQGLLDYAGYLYVMGLSLRDLQEALYLLVDNVLSRSVVNQVTLQVERQMHSYRQAALSQTPAILVVDGVWVEIQYALDEVKVDRAGHQRQVRQAQERVILAAMAIWPDGSQHLLHYTICRSEDADAWRQLFDELIARGLDADAVALVVSDGAKGLLEALHQRLPKAAQQRCITHKVRGMEPYLTYAHLPDQDAQGQALATAQAKRLRLFQIQQAAYAIYDAPTAAEAHLRLHAFAQTWQPLEPKAVHAFTWGIQRTFEFYRFDQALQPLIRTTNALERFFREFRTKADEIGAFPNENSCLTLFFLVLRREHAKHDRLILANNP